MARENETVSVTKRANGSYQVTVGYGGTTLRRSSKYWSYQDAKKIESDLLNQARRAALGEKPERTLAQGLEKWLIEYVPKLRSAKEARSKARMLFPYIVGKKISEAPEVWAFIKGDMTGKSPATINHRGRVLRQICNLAETEWGWTDKPLGRRIKLLPETPREFFLSAEQVEALAVQAGGKAGDLIRLAAYTGIRYGHMMRLTHHDVKDGWITLDRTSKNRRLQQIPVHPRLKDIVTRLPLGIGEAELRREWTAARAALGLSHVRWHDLRHTCASWLVQAGVPLTTVRDMLGHSTIAVTNRYAHLAPEHLREAIQKLA